METTVFEIELTQGRVFRINCENRSQKKRVLNSFYRLQDRGLAKSIEPIINGIHTVKQWEQIVEKL